MLCGFTRGLAQNGLPRVRVGLKQLCCALVPGSEGMQQADADSSPLPEVKLCQQLCSRAGQRDVLPWLSCRGTRCAGATVQARAAFCQPWGRGRRSLPEGGCCSSSGTCWQDGWGLGCMDVPLPRNAGVAQPGPFPWLQHSVGWERRGALVLSMLWHELFSYKSAVVCSWSCWDTKVRNVQFVYLSVWVQLRNSNRCLEQAFQWSCFLSHLSQRPWGELVHRQHWESCIFCLSSPAVAKNTSFSFFFLFFFLKAHTLNVFHNLEISVIVDEMGKKMHGVKWNWWAGHFWQGCSQTQSEGFGSATRGFNTGFSGSGVRATGWIRLCHV